MEQIVIRPIPEVFEDYNQETYTHTAQPTSSVSLKKITASQGTSVYLTEKVEYPEYGILMKYKDVPYFRQGFVFPEAMDSINNLKKVLVLLLALVKGNGRGLIKGRIESAMAHFCWIANWMFQWYNPNMQKISKIFLKPERYRQSVRELIKLINNFLENLGMEAVGPNVAKQDFGKVIGTLIEYDNAYHWRMEDIFSETTRERLLANPRKEIKRLLEIYKQREKQGIEFKADSIVKVLRFLLLIPSVKKAFKKTIESINVENLKMTKDDSYFTMNYQGYDFQGKTLGERQIIWLEMTNGVPPERVYIPVQ